MIQEKKMKYVGAHVSAAGGVFHAPSNAKSIKANAFALFLKNQRQWVARPYTEEEVKKFKSELKKSEIPAHAVLPHGSYLINLGNKNPEAKEKSYQALVDEMRRAHQLGLPYVNVHPGAHLNKMVPEDCMDLIADNINKAISEVPGVTVVLESTAGQGSGIGHSFEELSFILKKVKNKKRIGFCLDTCHMFAAGYDISQKKGYQAMVKSFDDLISFKYLKGMHLNDSKVKLGSRVDRHMNLGDGEIGLYPFKEIMKDERFDGIPLILETTDPERWEKEIKMLRSFE